MLYLPFRCLSAASAFASNGIFFSFFFLKCLHFWLLQLKQLCWPPSTCLSAQGRVSSCMCRKLQLHMTKLLYLCRPDVFEWLDFVKSVLWHRWWEWKVPGVPHLRLQLCVENSACTNRGRCAGRRLFSFFPKFTGQVHSQKIHLLLWINVRMTHCCCSGRVP